MAMARKCDRCGVFYEPYSIWNGGIDSASRSGKPSSIIFALTDRDNAKYCTCEYKEIPKTGKKTKDLCMKCMDELLAWWSGREVLTMADLIDRDALEPFYESGTDPNDTYADMTFIRAEHIENAPAVNRWISVEDALPDKKQKVLVFYKAIGEKNNIHDDVIATNWRKGNGDFIPFEGYEITHWMPLPEPPENG